MLLDLVLSIPAAPDIVLQSWIGAAIAAGASLIGGMMNNSSNSAQAEENRDFQEWSYKNRYQWTMQDMEKAGMNPIFAYQNGVGTGLPGSTAVMQNPVDDAVDSYAAVSNNAIARKRLDAEVKLLEEQRKNTNMDTTLKSSLIGVNAMKEITERWNAASAKLVYEMNEDTKQLAKRDARYELDNPELMKIRKWMSSFGSILGNSQSVRRIMGGN